MSIAGELEITTQDRATADLCYRYWCEDGDGGYLFKTTELIQEYGLAHIGELLQIVLANSRFRVHVGECRICGGEIRRCATNRTNGGPYAWELLCDEHQAEQRRIEKIEEIARQQKRKREEAYQKAQAEADEKRRRETWKNRSGVELSFTREELRAAILRTIDEGGGWNREDGGLEEHAADALLGEFRDALLATQEELARSGAICYDNSRGGWIRDPSYGARKLTIVREVKVEDRPAEQLGETNRKRGEEASEEKSYRTMYLKSEEERARNRPKHLNGGRPPDNANPEQLLNWFRDRKTHQEARKKAVKLPGETVEQ